MFLFLHFETCYLINLIPYFTVSKKAENNLAIAQTPIKPVKYQPTTCFSLGSSNPSMKANKGYILTKTMRSF